MTDHKFTDDDVIKALECCSNTKDLMMCQSCPYESRGCNIHLLRDALVLINRQKAQIESLNAIHADAIESLRLAAEANKDMQAEIERLTAERDNEHRCYLHICEDLKQAVNRNITAKSEAIKEFAERAIDLAVCKDNGDGTERMFVSIANLRKIAKEMTEGGE